MIRARCLWCAISVVVISLFGFGCGSEASTSSTRAPEPEEPVLNFLNWEEYIEPELLVRFEEETGIKVNLEAFGSTEQLESFLQEDHRQYDLVVVDHTTLKHYEGLGVLGEIQSEWIPNLSNLMDFGEMECDRTHKMSVPYFIGTSVLIYNKDKVQEPPTSWSAFWDPAYAGKVGIMEDHWDYLGLGLVKKGYTYSHNDPTVWPQAIKGFAEVLEGCGLVTEFDDIMEHVISGEIIIGSAYSGDAALFAKENPSLGYVLPKEGSMMWTDLLAVTRHAKHPRNAHRFINFLLEPENAAANANSLSYPTVVTDAVPLLDPSIKEDPCLTLTPEHLERCPPYHAVSQELIEVQKELRILANRFKEASPHEAD